MEAAEALQAESRDLGARETALAEEAEALGDEIREILLLVPDLPSPDAPDGASEDDNPVLRTGGPDPDRYADHQRVPHWETGEALAIIDVERGVKLAGSMFVAFRGMGATLSRASVSWPSIATPTSTRRSAPRRSCAPRSWWAPVSPEVQRRRLPPRPR